MDKQPLRLAWTWIEQTLAAAPDWMIGLAALIVAAVAAFLVHAVITASVRRLTGADQVYLRLLLSRTNGPTRLALIIFSVGVAAQWAKFDPDTRAAITHGLAIGFIVLAGWIANIVVSLSADLYLRRFTRDTAEALSARKHLTQVRILQRAANTLVVWITAAAALMTFESVRQYGVSLFASAGLVGIIAGLAARPVLSNLFAGIQIAMTQPIRIEDAVVVENEFGWIEEIGSTNVVVRLWDRRRMVVPLSYFIEKPFQNWTRQSSTDLLGSISLYVDYTAPVERIRDKLREIASQSSWWDRQTVLLQVIDAKETAIQLRALVSAANADALGNLTAEVREKLVAFLQREHPEALPRRRADIDLTTPAGAQSGKPD